jgi:tRNA 5-methylaminomethyl-2-thiouridine biosynthesis bifunctional protein
VTGRQHTPAPLASAVKTAVTTAVTTATHATFLQQHQLPQRWAGQPRFVVLLTSFDEGHLFLQLWQAWRDDPARCRQLCVVALVQPHTDNPATALDAQRLLQHHAGTPIESLAAELANTWPPLTANLHPLHFEAERVQLLLAVPAAHTSPNKLPAKLRLQANAMHLVAAAHPALQAITRLLAPNATVTCEPQHPELLTALMAAVQQHPHAPQQRLAYTPQAAAAQPRTAVVVGAGLAGAAAALALAQQGLQVLVLDSQAAAAAGASGNAAGMFHGTVNRDDSIYARWFRAATLVAQRVYAQAINCGQVPGSTAGLLRLDKRQDSQQTGLASLQALLQNTGLPSSYVQALSAQAASQLAGVPLADPALFFAGAGWVAPAAWVRHALAAPGVQTRLHSAVASVRRALAGGWQVLDAGGQVLAQADVLVLAAAAATPAWLQGLGYAGLGGQSADATWPLARSGGQVTHWAWPGGAAHTAPQLRCVVAGDGYAVQLPASATGLDQGPGLLCGATRHPENETDSAAWRDQTQPAVTAADHVHNLQRLQRLTGITPPSDPMLLQGRSGWRLHSNDRLPIAGGMPLLPLPPQTQQRLNDPRLLPREPGLFVLTALGARGLTLAPLLGQLVAAQAVGAPWPVEQDLADAVDPARWWVRAARRTPAA